MRIKKQYFYGFLGVMSLGLGLFLLTELLRVMGRYGAVGYGIIIVFISSLVLYLRYELEVKNKEKIADEVTEQIVEEYKTILPANNLRDLSEIEKELNKHLKDKIYNEEYTFIKSKKTVQ